MVNKLELDDQDVTTIVNALANLPFRQVAPLIQKIDRQLTEQKEDAACGSSTESTAS